MIPVFLSVGRVESASHSAFVEALENRLATFEIELRRAKNSHHSPLEKIRREMARCEATIIVAHERLYLNDAVEFRGAGAKENSITGKALPTVWNHIEAMLALEKQHPLLVFCEEHIKEEGMLEPVGSYYVHRVPFTLEYLGSRDFGEIIAEWLEDIRKRKSWTDRISRAFRSSFMDGIDNIAPLIGIIAILMGLAYWLGSTFGGLP